MSIKQITFLLLLACCALPLAAQNDTATPPDGPYLLYSEGNLEVKWAYPERKEAGGLSWERAAQTNELPRFPGFDPAVVDPDRTFVRNQQLIFTGVEKVAAISDIHGQYDVAKRLLTVHGIMDEEGNWTYGTGHLVIVGDVFDRGDEVNAILWTIHKLQVQAEAAGGKVHYLLGNHETMILDADIRYVHKRYLKTQAILQIPYHDLYGPDTYLGRWLRSLPLTVKINGDIFVHGGFSKDLIRTFPSLQKINDRYHAELIDRDPYTVMEVSERLKLLHGRQGPLWYRGYFMDRKLREKDIDWLLRKLDARRFVVGHTSFTSIMSYHSGKVLGVDSSIKFGSVGELLLLQGNQSKRGLLDGRVLLLENLESR